MNAPHLAAAESVTRADDILARYVELLERPFWSDASPVEIADELGVDVQDVLRAEERYLRRRKAHRLIAIYEDIIRRRGLELDWYELGITFGEAYDSGLEFARRRTA